MKPQPGRLGECNVKQRCMQLLMQLLRNSYCIIEFLQIMLVSS